MTTENLLATRPVAITEPLNRQVVQDIALSYSFGGVRFMNMVEVMDFAKMMSLSDLAVPKHLRSNPGACLAVVIQSIEMAMSPFALANKSYVVNDRLCYESAIYHAVAIKRGVKGRIIPEYSGEGHTRVVTLRANMPNGQSIAYKSPEFGKITTKNSPLWKSDPDQQLFYYAVRAMVRRYFPDVMMGVYTEDEIEPAPIDSADTSTAAEPVITLDSLAGEPDPPSVNPAPEPPADATQPAPATDAPITESAQAASGDGTDEPKALSPDAIPTTHESLVCEISMATGLSEEETRKRLKLVLPKPLWVQIRDKSGFWRRFCDGELEGLKPQVAAGI